VCHVACAVQASYAMMLSRGVKQWASYVCCVNLKHWPSVRNNSTKCMGCQAVGKLCMLCQFEALAQCSEQQHQVYDHMSVSVECMSALVDDTGTLHVWRLSCAWDCVML
jgi:hypothetical protein